MRNLLFHKYTTVFYYIYLAVTVVLVAHMTYVNMSEIISLVKSGFPHSEFISPVSQIAMPLLQFLPGVLLLYSLFFLRNKMIVPGKASIVFRFVLKFLVLIHFSFAIRHQLNYFGFLSVWENRATNSLPVALHIAFTAFYFLGSNICLLRLRSAVLQHNAF